MLYSKITRIALILLIPFLLSSCFDIKEEIYLKKNGSGTYQFVIDMSKLKLLIGAMEDKVNDEKEKQTES
mgnify:CR=1 FL=1